jgi:hypothetical protein
MTPVSSKWLDVCANPNGDQRNLKSFPAFQRYGCDSLLTFPTIGQNESAFWIHTMSVPNARECQA